MRNRIMCWVLLIILPMPALAELSGLQIVRNAQQAAGGEAWLRPQTLMLEGTMRMYRNGEADALTWVDDYRMWRIFPAASESAHSANGKVRFDARSGGSTVFQVAWDGRHSYDQNGRIESGQADRQWSSAFGFGIIRFADQPGFTVERLVNDQVEGHTCHFVRVTDPSGSETVFAIDAGNWAIRKVGFDTPRGWHERIYSEFAWNTAPRFRQALRVRLYYDGRKTNDISWHRFTINQPIDPSLFRIAPEDSP